MTSLMQLGEIIGRKGKILAASAVIFVAAGPAWANSPHFVGRVTAKLVDQTNVQICFKEAGLGNNLNIDFLASANATATYVCKTNSGQCPNAANKTTVSGPVTAEGTFNSGRNGTINSCLTLTPPGPGSFTCPPGQTATLSEFTFTGISITDVTNNITASATPSTFSGTPFTCPTHGLDSESNTDSSSGSDAATGADPSSSTH